MTDKRGKADKRGAKSVADPLAFWQSLFPGADWGAIAVKGPVRAQAKAAAEALRQLNAPIVGALARQRELADLLAATAKQTREVAERVEQLAGQHSALTEQFEAALEPYLRYVDWLGSVGSGRDSD